MIKKFINGVIKMEGSNPIIVDLDTFKNGMYDIYTINGISVASKDYLKTLKNGTWYDLNTNRKTLGLEDVHFIYRTQLREYKSIEWMDLYNSLDKYGFFKDFERYDGKLETDKKVVYGDIYHLNTADSELMEALNYFKKYGCTIKEYRYKYAPEVRGVAFFIPSSSKSKVIK